MYTSVLFAPITFAIMTVAAPSGFSERASCSKITMVTHTFYGFPDNDPAGPAIAYDCGRGAKAGGDGSFANPLTFASAPSEFTKCEVIYDPYLRKYLRFEDTCEKCTSDWKSNIRHIDVWTGSDTVNGGEEQKTCEDNLTPNAQTIIRNPSHDLTVDTTQLYQKGASPACRTSHTFLNYNPNDYCSS